MSIGSAEGRRVSLARQSSKSDTIPSAATAAIAVRRSTTGVNLTRDAYDSNEVSTDAQERDSGLGTHRVAGPLDGEAFLGHWSKPQESLLARDYTAISTISAHASDGFTFVGSTGVLTRAGGTGSTTYSFLTDGLTKGRIVKPANLHASINGKLAYVSAVAALSVTLKFLDGTVGSDVASPDTDASLVIPGKVTYVPSTGRTKHYYMLEDFLSDIADPNAPVPTTDQASVFWNLLVNGATLTIQPNNFVNWSYDMLGDGRSEDFEGSAAPYLSSVTDGGTERAFRCSAIWLVIDGKVTGTVTSGTLQISRNATAPAVAGSNYSPDVLPHKYTVSLNITQLLESLAMRSKLRLESEFSAAIVMQAVGSTEFFGIELGRLKLTAHSIDDAADISETLTAKALKTRTATGILETTISFQDSTLV